MITFIGDDNITAGGVQVLIVNLITEFHKRNIPVKLYCRKGSYIYNKLKEIKTEYIHIDADEINFYQLDNYILNNDTLVISSFMKELLFIKKSNPKFIYWVVLSNFEQYAVFTLFKGKFKLNLFNSLLKRTIYNLIASGSLFFMDGSTLKDVERIYGKISTPEFIPIPINCKSSNLFSLKNRNSIISGILSITYIGRGDSQWKVYPIVKFAEDLVQIDSDLIFQLNIITDTDIKYKKSLNHINSDKLIVKYDLGLDQYEIEKHLLANSDLHIAMGTSALEGAKLGIPTILIDASNQPFPSDYKYRWLFDSNTDFTLGYWIDKDSDYSNRGSKLENLLEVYLKNMSFRLEISELCFRYTNQNHNIKNVVDRLIDCCEKTKSNTSFFYKFNPFIFNIKIRIRINRLLNRY